MSGLYRTKIGVGFNFGDSDDNTTGTFKSVWDYLKYLETENIVEEIARNSGSNANGTGWPDEPNNFGDNAWAVFKWHTSSIRSWEWYLYIQNSTLTPNTAPASPGLSEGSTSAGNNGVLWSCAISISGSETENPWGGTTGSLGSDTKGDPVWVTSSADYDLFAFPRSNSEGGSHATSRQNMGTLAEQPNSTQGSFIHMFSDDDSIVFCSKVNNSEDSFSFAYLGLYEPAFSTISSSVSASFVALNCGGTDTSLFDTNAGEYGPKNGNGFLQGGVVGVDGVNTVMVDYPTNPVGSGEAERSFHPNDLLDNVNTGSYAKFLVLPIPIFVSVTEQNPGLLGFINNKLLKQAIMAPPFFVNPERTMMSFSTTTYNGFFNTFVTPWTGSFDPQPRGSRTREGYFSGVLDI